MVHYLASLTTQAKLLLYLRKVEEPNQLALSDPSPDLALLWRIACCTSGLTGQQLSAVLTHPTFTHILPTYSDTIFFTQRLAHYSFTR